MISALCAGDEVQVSIRENAAFLRHRNGTQHVNVIPPVPEDDGKDECPRSFKTSVQFSLSMFFC